MAGAKTYRSTEHDESDRTFFAGLLIVLGLMGSMLALAHRQTISRASAPGDACPTSAHGGIVGLDAQTGEVRWTNVVPDGGHLLLDKGTGEVHLVRPSQDAREPEEALVVDRVVDPATGSITSCSAHRRHLTGEQQNELLGYDDPLEPPLQIDDTTVAKWGQGLRATDPTNTGIWSIDKALAQQRLGDDLLIDHAGNGQAGTARIDLRTGAQRWRTDAPLVRSRGEGSTILTSRWEHPDRFSALDPATGEVRWTTKVPFDPDDVTVGAVASFDLGSLLIIPIDFTGRMAALGSATGRVRWTAEPESPGRSRRFPRSGNVRDAVLSGEGTTVIVAIDAWQPEEDD